MRRVVVIGGGISGLATAALLAREGASVTLVESRDSNQSHLRISYRPSIDPRDPRGT